MSSSYGELYREGRGILEAVPLQDAALDARILLEEVCGTSLQTLLVYPETMVTEEDCARYRALIERRRLREPTAMILGEWDFMGLSFRVTKDTLIPEQDTEVLVETVLGLLPPGPVQGKTENFEGTPAAGSGCRMGHGVSVGMADAPPRPAPGAVSLRKELRILDLCTGSGCILFSLLHYLPQASGIGTDISAGALAAAQENAERLGLTGRSLLCCGDLWEALPDQKEQFDLIVSNPPYVPTAVIDTLEPEVRCGEPYAALDGGEDGLTFYRRILAEADRHLQENGLLILESGFDEAEEICGLMEEAGYEVLHIVKDYGGLDRVLVGRLPGGLQR